MYDDNSNKIMIIKSFIFFFISAILAFVIYWSIGRKIIHSFYYLNSNLIESFLYLCHVEILYLLFKIILKLRIYTFEKEVFSFSYILFIPVLFLSQTFISQKAINVHIIESFDILKYCDFSSILLNILIFCPFYTVMKWMYAESSFKTIFLIFIIFSIGIEITQIFTMNSILDAIDIIFYFIGFFIGVMMYHAVFKRKDI